MQDWRRRRRPSKRPSVVVPFVPRPSRWRVDGIDIRLMLAFILPLAFVVGGMLARDAAGDGAGIVENGKAAIVGVASVIDGDTIEIHGRRIRLEGIDAPESKQTCIRDGVAERCGQRAALHLTDRIGRLVVSCEPTGTDRYGRTLAICSEGGEDLNGMMVRDGMAVAYRAFSSRYVDEEAAARGAGRGIWATDFEMPWDWRRNKAVPSDQQ